MKEIPLRNKHGETVAFALVDDPDYERVFMYRWSMESSGGVRRLDHGRNVGLARFLLGITGGDPRQVRHRNADQLACRRDNLVAVRYEPRETMAAVSPVTPAPVSATMAEV